MGNQTEVPVLIVGGGIVGLSASLFLSKLGVRSLLVERHSGTSIHPRARGFNVRTMELFRGLGVDEAVREAGAELSASAGIFKGHSLVEVIEPQPRSRQGGGRAAMPGDGLIRTVSPTIGARGTQDLVEPVLLAAARAESKAEIRFYTEYLGIQQDDSGITATIRDRDSGNTSTIRASYMIAADGAGSPVRQELGIATTGRGVLGNLINILFEADLRELVRGREFSLCLIERPEVRGLFTSINNSNRWVFHLSYDPASGQKPEDFPPERCAELVKIALGKPDVEITIKSCLPWQSAVRVAESFRRDRVFLAGDAAHQMPPWGGQGATSGIADVHNLSWKLAAVLNGQAGPVLLDTYDTERLPVGRLVAEESGAAADANGLFAVGAKATLLVRMISRAPRLLGYGYRYQSSATVWEDETLLRMPWHLTAWILDLTGRPGTRVPHLWVRQNDQQISTVDVCKEKFVLLIADNGEVWRKAAHSVADRLAIDVPVYSISPEGDLEDPSGQWLSLAGISKGGAMLVRPDGFVAWRSYHQISDASERLYQVMRGILSI